MPALDIRLFCPALHFEITCPASKRILLIDNFVSSPQPQNIMVTLPGQSPTMHTTNGDGIDVNKESVTAVATASELKEVKRSSSASASNTASANTAATSKPADASAHPAPSTSAASAPASAPAPAPPADAGDAAPRKQLEFSHAIKYVNAIKVNRRLMIEFYLFLVVPLFPFVVPIRDLTAHPSFLQNTEPICRPD